MNRLRGADRETGFGLVEVMVAMALFVIGSLSLLSVLTGTLSGTFDNRARVTAANLAAADIDEARSLDYYALSNSEITKTVDGRSYRVVRTVATTLASGATTSSCVGTTGSARPMYKRVSTHVETAFRGTAQPVRADTLVRAPIFDPNSARGAIAFVVLDRSGQPLSGLPISVGATTLSTDAQGCAFFDGLLPGTHVVTVTRPGSVKIDGDTSLTRSVAVAAGQITSEAMRVGRVATITVVSKVFGTALPADFHLPTGLAVELATPTRDGATRVVAPQPVTGADRVFSVFPEVGGYEAYLGHCFPVVATPSEPNTSTTVELPLSPITVHMKTQNNSMNPGAQDRGIEVLWRSTSGCTATLSYTVKTSPGCSGPADANSADACKIKIAVPAGDWRFKPLGVVFYKDATVTAKTASNVDVSW